jgi:hypothetical protein
MKRTITKNAKIRRIKRITRTKRKIKNKSLKCRKLHKGGGPQLDSYMRSKYVSTKITQEMVDLYGYPKKYIGYDVAISPSGIKKPFTISEMCELVWLSKKQLDFTNLLSESNIEAINTQLDKDISRDVTVFINGQDVKTTSPPKNYDEFINQQFVGVPPETIVQIKLLINQFALSTANDIMSISLPKYKDEHIMVQPLSESTLETYKNIFPNINDNKIINVTHNGNNIIIDESYFSSLIILKPVDPFENISDDPIENMGVANVFVYCDFKKDVGFFIWKSVIKEPEPDQNQGQQEEEEEDDGQPRSRLFPAIAIGSLVTTGAVLGTLFGLGIIGGKTKRKRILRKIKTSKKNRKKKN